MKAGKSIGEPPLRHDGARGEAYPRAENNARSVCSYFRICGLPDLQRVLASAVDGKADYVRPIGLSRI